MRFEAQPSIFPFGLRIDEPVTMLTDILVGAACLVGYFRLVPLNNGGFIQRNILLYFLLMGLATLLGGIVGHGFIYALGLFWKLPGWLLSMVAVNLLERVMIHFSAAKLSPRLTRLFFLFNIIELLLFMALAFGTLNFIYVQIHATYGFVVVVLSFSIYNYKKHHHREIMKNMIIGVGLIFICAVVFVAKWGVSKWLNHADIAHLFMLAAVPYFYQASKGIMKSTNLISTEL